VAVCEVHCTLSLNVVYRCAVHMAHTCLFLCVAVLYCVLNRMWWRRSAVQSRTTGCCSFIIVHSSFVSTFDSSSRRHSPRTHRMNSSICSFICFRTPRSIELFMRVSCKHKWRMRAVKYEVVHRTPTVHIHVRLFHHSPRHSLAQCPYPLHPPLFRHPHRPVLHSTQHKNEARNARSRRFVD
jgi:hypothetical protein